MMYVHRISLAHGPRSLFYFVNLNLNSNLIDQRVSKLIFLNWEKLEVNF